MLYLIAFCIFVLAAYLWWVTLQTPKNAKTDANRGNKPGPGAANSVPADAKGHVLPRPEHPEHNAPDYTIDPSNTVLIVPEEEHDACFQESVEMEASEILGLANRNLRLAEVVTLKGHDQWVNCVSFSSDGMWVVSGASDQLVKLWNLQDNSEERTFFGHTAKVLCVAFAPDGNMIASGSADETVILWSVETGEIIRTFDDFQAPINSVSFSRDSRYLGIQSGMGVHIQDLQEDRRIRTRSRHEFECQSVAFPPRPNTVVLGCVDAVVELWDLETVEEIDSFVGAMRVGTICALAITADGALVAGGSPQRNVNVWSLANGRKLYSFRGHGAGEYQVAFSIDHILAGWGRSKSVDFWDMATGRQLNSLESKEWINTFAFSPNGKFAVTGGADKSVIVYELVWM